MPIAHIAPVVVAVFVEAIDAGKVTTADVVAVVGEAELGYSRDTRKIGQDVKFCKYKTK